MRVRRAAATALAGFLAVVPAAAGPATSPIDVREPEGLYEGPSHGYVPVTLKGAEVIDPRGLEALIARADPVLIDVSLADRRPDNLPPGTVWLPAHRSIPGAVWLPEAGAAPLPPRRETALHERILALTRGDRRRAIVVFYHPECWGGWNLGRRLVDAGHARVHWFPAGIEGWQETHDTVPVRPDPAWTKAAGAAAPDPGR